MIRSPCFTVAVALAVFALRIHGQHVVFEEVGQIATSLSYVHVAIPLNISGIKQLIKDYQTALGQEEGNFPFSQWTDNFYDNHFDHRFTSKIIGPAMKDFKEVLRELNLRAARYTEKLKNLTDLMPTVSAVSTETYDTELVHLRHRRFAPFLAPLIMRGVFGTIHGLYTKSKYDKLKTELNTVIKTQHRLVASSREHDTAINCIINDTAQVRNFMGNLTVFAPALIISKLRNMETMIEDEVDKLWSAMQAAQHRRLSIKLLSAKSMSSLFRRISSRAAASGNQLLLDRPSDLYQIEMSYCYDGEDVTLILHVPMAQSSTTLRLLKFLPFPFSFSATHFLMPQPEKKLLAISSDEPRLSMEIKEADLEGCHRVNNLYLCERQGILKNRMDLTCLGSLYGQKFKRAIELCEMKALPISEQVLQLNDHWFLVYAMQQFTAYITCRNHTSSEIHLAVGVNKISVSANCKVKLQDHVLYADTALKDPNSIIQFSFSLADTSFTPAELQESEEVLEELSIDGENDPTLDNLRQLKALRKRFPRWIWFVSLASVLGGALLLLLLFGIVCSQRWMLLRRSVRLIADAIWPPTNPHVIYDVQAPPARLPPAAAAAAAAAVNIEQDDVDGIQLHPIQPPEAVPLRERRVDHLPHPVQIHRGARGYGPVDFIRMASRRLRGRRHQGQPDALPEPFRRQRLALY